MQVRSRKAFNSEYGRVRVGEIFTCEPQLAKEYERLGNVEVLPDRIGPDRIQAKTTAPRIKEGKGLPTESPLSSLPENMAGSRDDGEVTQSSVSLPGRRSRKRT